MSLYTYEEICEGCIFSRWIDADEFWDKKPRYARCEIYAESSVDCLKGECLQKEEKKND